MIGVSTHPLNESGRLFSAEFTGFMSQRNEMGAGLRYTQELSQNQIIDFNLASGQESRGLTLGAGMDFALTRESSSSPRLSVKPYVQHQRFETSGSNLLGFAPTIRKGFSINGHEFFPYLALPAGMKVDSATDKFVNYASLTFGASMPFPASQNDQMLLSLEANKNMGSSSDYLSCLVTWMWK